MKDKTKGIVYTYYEPDSNIETVYTGLARVIEIIRLILFGRVRVTVPKVIADTLIKLYPNK